MERLEKYQELEKAYDKMAEEQIALSTGGRLKLHPTYLKWLPCTQLIDSIWARVENTEISQSKAREMTALAIERYLEEIQLKEL